MKTDILPRWNRLARPGGASLHGIALAVACLHPWASAHAQSEIDLSLVGPSTFVAVGQVVEVRLRAESTPVGSLVGTNFVAIDCIFSWNPAHLRLLGLTTAGSVPLLSSYLPNPAADYTGINEASPPADGDALYYALAPLGNPIACPPPGVQITTFRFEVLAPFESTTVEILPSLTVDFETYSAVYDGTVPGLDVLGAATGCTLEQEPPCPGSVAGIGPVFAGVPEDLVIAADAGRIDGAFVGEPVVTAVDACDESLAVDFEATGAFTGTTWPVDGMFPVGTTQLAWRATDEVGNETVETRAVVVADHQLLDAFLAFDGVFAGDSLRTVRIESAGWATVVEAGFTGATALVPALEVPVAAGYGCVRAKDLGHSLGATTAATVESARYAAAFTLVQGDTNDDDAVDVLDFGLFVGDIGGPVATNAPSNFNADLLVNNADFSVIAIHFFSVGETCGGAAGAMPVARASVKDLRRAGLGHLAVADLDRNGWLDLRDVAHFAAHGAGPALRGGGDLGIE